MLSRALALRKRLFHNNTILLSKMRPLPNSLLNTSFRGVSSSRALWQQSENVEEGNQEDLKSDQGQSEQVQEAQNQGEADTTPGTESTEGTGHEEAKEPTPEEKLAEAEEKVKEYHEKLLYAMAENQNVLERSKANVEKANKFAIKGFAKEMIIVADTLQIAIDAERENAAKSDADASFKTLFEGLEMTHKVLLHAMEKFEVVKFNPVGEKFDPNFHDGVYMYEDPDKEPGTVGNVVKEGYKIYDQVLRPAQVGTIKPPQ